MDTYTVTYGAKKTSPHYGKGWARETRTVQAGSYIDAAFLAGQGVIHIGFVVIFIRNETTGTTEYIRSDETEVAK